jgi:hypothetical protein
MIKIIREALPYLVAEHNGVVKPSASGAFGHIHPAGLCFLLRSVNGHSLIHVCEMGMLVNEDRTFLAED